MIQPQLKYFLSEVSEHIYVTFLLNIVKKNLFSSTNDSTYLFLGEEAMNTKQDSRKRPRKKNYKRNLAAFNAQSNDLDVDSIVNDSDDSLKKA